MKTIPTNKQTIEYLKGKLDRMPLDGRWTVDIHEIPTKVRMAQRAMYFCWMAYLAEYYSGTKDDKYYYHEEFKKKFLKPKKVKRFGWKTDYYTTKGMSKDEFSVYMTQVYDEMFTMGIELPRELGTKYDQMMEIYG